MTEKEAWIAWSTFVPFGPAHIKLLVEYFGSAEKAWEAPIKQLTEIGLSPSLVAKLKEHRSNLDLDLYLNSLEKLGIDVILKDDEEYPARLKEIDDTPYLLYARQSCKGTPCKANLAEISEVGVAVVGSRKATSYGKDVTERLVAGLVDAGVTIVSGLALGIDAIAHKTAVDCKGSTIAVLGNGLDTIYPPSNRLLARRMLESKNGTIISEYPLGYPALPQNFPYRNRIVSGMSLAVLVIEGTAKSGTLLTASCAARQGRDVFAVPGPITSILSQAPNLLIKQGAKLVERAEDILEELKIESRIKNYESKKTLPETKEEEKLLSLLEREGLDVDSIVRISGLDVGIVLGTLTSMELKGMVKNVGGEYRKV